MRSTKIVLTLAIFLIVNPSGKTWADEIVVDTVLASVDGAPITLRDVQKKIGGGKLVKASDVAKDPEVKYILDSLIVEKMILSEAESRKIGVSDTDVEGYINEVAKQNSLTRDEFEKALAKGGRTMTEYKGQVKIEIIKSRLASSSLVGGVGVSEEEIDNYLKESDGSKGAGNIVALRLLLISKSERTDEEYQKRLDEVKAKISSGADFASLVETYSDGPQKADGGKLGAVPESDLSQEIFNAILSLKDGETSAAVESSDGARFFFVESRTTQESGAEDKSKAEEARENARRILQRRKLEAKMQTFFTEDLAKMHTIDRKI